MDAGTTFPSRGSTASGWLRSAHAPAWRPAFPDQGVGQPNRPRIPLTSSRFTALRCYGEIFAAAALLLPIPTRDCQRTDTREHHVTVDSLQPVDADGHCACRWLKNRTTAKRGSLAKVGGIHDASGSSSPLYKCAARIRVPNVSVHTCCSLVVGSVEKPLTGRLANQRPRPYRSLGVRSLLDFVPTSANDHHCNLLLCFVHLFSIHH